MAAMACPLPETTHGMTSKPFYASAAGDRLFVMAYRYIEELGPRPPPDDDKPPPAWSWSGIDNDADPPFCPQYVTCHARHPDGRTVFASVVGWRPGIAQVRQRNQILWISTVRSFRYTYLLLVQMRNSRFRYHGEWLLLFRGEAHYDGELDAWVGLADEAPGRVASCDLPLFEFESAGHLGATLVYMGGGSRYCLVECCTERMTTFALKYGKMGELRIVGRGGRASMAYTVAHDLNQPTLSPIAFWM
ncbi:hypothetical protein VPH35_125737 [Triticum aestivum]